VYCRLDWDQWSRKKSMIELKADNISDYYEFEGNYINFVALMYAVAII
jgi:hypothetical protein